MNPRRRRERGATLVEVLVSVTIFSFGMVGVHALVTHTVATQNAAGDISLATNIASSSLEDLQATPYDTVISGQTCWGKDGRPLACTGAYFTEVRTVALGPMDDYRDVSVAVTWGASIHLAKGSTHTVTAQGRVFPK